MNTLGGAITTRICDALAKMVARACAAEEFRRDTDAVMEEETTIDAAGPTPIRHERAKFPPTVRPAQPIRLAFQLPGREVRRPRRSHVRPNRGSPGVLSARPGAPERRLVDESRSKHYAATARGYMATGQQNGSAESGRPDSCLRPRILSLHSQSGVRSFLSPGSRSIDRERVERESPRYLIACASERAYAPHALLS